MPPTSSRSRRSASTVVARRVSSASSVQVNSTTWRSTAVTLPGAGRTATAAPPPDGPGRRRAAWLESPAMGRSLRIALLSYRSKPHGGGQGVYVRALSRELTELGHRVEVLSGQPYPDLDPGVALTCVPSLDLYREPDPFRTPRLAEFRDWVDVAE